MHSGLIFIGSLCVICWVIQFLPVISVPITGASINYNLHFSLFNNFTFGVFGVCDIVRNVCSEPQIGYPTSDLFFYVQSGETFDDDSLASIELPSEATHSISKLLVVHIVAFFFTNVLMLVTGFLLWLLHCDKHPEVLAWKVWIKPPTESSKPRKRKISGFLNWMFLTALLSFILTLLAFLADVLLFIPKLSFLGWIQLIPILVMAVIASLICFMKRSILSRKHLEEEIYPVNNDEMRAKNVHRWVDDSASDDGFYVYTNGFYSANNNESRAQQSGSVARRTPENNVTLENGEQIELRDMTGT